tara:strand:+ start:654 stop:1343 length:690 start_codon:yes stop_codon:yes gene_type:complete
MRLFDIKTNILPRIDPNCDSISESLSFLRYFKQRNLEKICSSPNFFDVGNNYLPDILIDLQKEASKLENFDIPEIFSSVIYPLNTNLIEFDNLITVNESNFIICKFPTFGIPLNFYEKLRYLINNNYMPIITNIVHSPVGKNQKILNDLFEIGCLFDIDIYDFFEFKNKKTAKIIKYMENQNSIITLSGLNKITEFEKSFERFSKQTGIDKDKLIYKYCWSNPNLIVSN